MEREFDSDDILLETTRSIEFPLYTQLDIFKFLRAYDLHRKCVNVSKDWRDVIQKYAEELPKFRDLGPEIEKLNKTLEAKQKRAEKFAQHIDILKGKRNKHYCFAAAVTLSTFTLCVLSSVLALYHIHEDATFSIADSLDEILAMVALSWTTLSFVHKCFYVSDDWKYHTEDIVLLILYLFIRILLLLGWIFVTYFFSINLNTSIKWLVILFLCPAEVYFWFRKVYTISIVNSSRLCSCEEADEYFSTLFYPHGYYFYWGSRRNDSYLRRHLFNIFSKILSASSTLVTLLFVHFYHPKGITVPALIFLFPLFCLNKKCVEFIINSRHITFYMFRVVLLSCGLLFRLLIFGLAIVSKVFVESQIQLSPVTITPTWAFWGIVLSCYSLELQIVCLKPFQYVYYKARNNWSVYTSVPHNEELL